MNAPAPVTIAVVTANQRRHAWFARHLADDPRIEVRAVVSEAKRPRPRGETEVQDQLIADHLAQRDEAEERYFGDAATFEELGVPLLGVSWGESNDQRVADWVGGFGVDLLVLFGSSIITEPLLVDFDQRTINIHLGLSPYYRGTASNFWPLVNGEPEYVGATVHLATLSVDAGPIIRQTRPDMTPEDGPHDIGCKALIAGADAMRNAIADLAAGAPRLVPQAKGGRLYKAKDFHVGAVETLRRRFADGLIADYLADKPARDAAVPIVE